MNPISRTFQYHKPSAGGVDKIEGVRQGFSDLEATLRELCPASRELSVCITNLETAAMWATKAVVMNDPDSVTDAP